MPLLNIDEALNRLLSATQTLEIENVSLSNIGLRQVLADDITAKLTEPPFRSSAMDGYAIRVSDFAKSSSFKVIGESAAGKGFSGKIGSGEAVRIFTGAPVPDDADCVVIQEKTEIKDDIIVITDTPKLNDNIRPLGGHFKKGDTVFSKGKVVSPAAIALCASSGYATIPVIRRPKVAILATGNELVAPGEIPGKDQIVCSNSFGLAQIARSRDCQVIDLGIARDNEESIRSAIKKARQEGADLLLTSGGVSVGKYDLVQTVLKDEGMELDFWKIAMRPGKPLMFGTLPGEHKMLVLGLPGNPVSSLVCAHLFLVPVLEKLSGRVYAPHIENAVLNAPLPKNGPRKHFIRANLTRGANGEAHVTPVSSPDSSMIRLMANADCLIIQEENGTPLNVGDNCRVFIPDEIGL